MADEDEGAVRFGVHGVWENGGGVVRKRRKGTACTHPQLRVNARKAMRFSLRFFCAAGLAVLAVSCASAPKSTAVYRGSRAALVNGRAVAPAGVPRVVREAIAAGNRIQKVPYEFGGGHGRRSRGLDCSGSVSYVLRSCGLLAETMPSSAFRKYGAPGPGRYITVYARPGHVFMTVCGLRLDTTSGGSGHVGPRWNAKPRNLKGFTARHPRGF